MSEFFIAHPWAETLVALGGLFLSAFIANFLIKAILLKLLERLVQKTSFGQDEELKRHSVISRLANIVPALIISSGIMAVPGLPEGVITVIRNVAIAFIILTLALAVNSVFGLIDTLYHRRPEARYRPIKGYIQVAKLAVYIVAAVLVIATLLDKSPVILLSGVGAMAAVLILV
ncbi:MAG: mechanosensitive ion channel family protein, partial [Brucella anthropi]